MLSIRTHSDQKNKRFFGKGYNPNRIGGLKGCNLMNLI